MCCPSLWNLGPTVTRRLFHEDGTPGRLLDVSAKAADVKTEHKLAQAELVGQNHRLTYVGLTRAIHQTIVWWAPVRSDNSSVATVLFGSGAKVPKTAAEQVDAIHDRVADAALGDELRVGVVPPRDQLIRDRPRRASDRALRPGAPEPADASDGAVDQAGPALTVATLTRPIDRSAGRWSFTAITHRASEGDAATAEPVTATGAPAGTDPDDPTLGDAADSDEQNPPPPVLFDGLGAGAAFGTLVHDALEHLDFTGDVEGDLTAYLSSRPWAAAQPDRLPGLVTALAAAVRTPLGDAFDGARLDQLVATDRLDELDFEVPIGAARHGGDGDGGGRRLVPTTAIGGLLLQHLAADDPVRPWAGRLADGLIDVDLGGYLTGSIDLVMRLPAPGVPGGARFSVVDYKTNRLGTWGVPDVISNYHPDVLPAAMDGHHYPLQAVLYSVALHRYLRWRLPGYSPELHLGPVGYLFVRGMVGPATPAPGGRTHGVCVWTPPASAVVALSDLLHGMTS